MRRLFRGLGVLFFSALAGAQTADVPPGENLVVEGIPKIPASLAQDVKPYTEFRPAIFEGWHPTKREMLIRKRAGETFQVHWLKTPGSAEERLTSYPDPIAIASFPPKERGFFVFSKDTNGDERFQNYRYDLADGKVTLLTGGKTRHSPGFWSHSGNRMVYGKVKINLLKVLFGGSPVSAEVRVVDPADPGSDRVVTTVKGVGWSFVDWSPDDRKALAIERISINENYLWLFDMETGEKKLLTPKTSSEVSYGGGEFHKDGKGIYVSTDRDSEFRRLAYIDLATMQHTFLTDHIPWDVEEIDLSPDGKTLSFLTNENGFSVLHFLDTATGQEKPAPKLPAGIISGIQWHKNGKDLGLMLQSARSMADVYSLDVETGRLDRWTSGETGGLNTENFSEPELVRWKSFDGREISGFLYRPPSKFTGKLPVIVNIHGGPESQFRPAFLGRNNYFLNELGIAILFPNIRGSTGYGKTFLKLDNGFRREDAYKDIGALLDWIAEQPDLDAGRVMVTGASYGGHMTLATATLYPERIRCALDIVGPSNFVTFLKNTERYRRDLRRVEYGDEREPKMREFLEKIAPLNNAVKINKPLFVVQGKNDPRAPLSESEQIVRAVRDNATPVWYLMAKDEGHGFAKKKNVDFQFYATVLFLQQHLLR